MDHMISEDFVRMLLDEVSTEIQEFRMCCSSCYQVQIGRASCRERVSFCV